MTFIVPFEAEFSREVRTVYAVNNDNPTRDIRSNVTTSEECPHCGERSFFRVYEEKSFHETEEYVTEIYDCKCPECRKEFDLVIEFEI